MNIRIISDTLHSDVCHCNNDTLMNQQRTYHYKYFGELGDENFIVTFLSNGLSFIDVAIRDGIEHLCWRYQVCRHFCSTLNFLKVSIQIISFFLYTAYSNTICN